MIEIIKNVTYIFKNFTGIQVVLIFLSISLGWVIKNHFDVSKEKAKTRNTATENIREKGKSVEFELQKEWGLQELKQKDASWNQSTPLTNEYLNNIDNKRYVNITNLENIVNSIEQYITSTTITNEELVRIKGMLKKIDIPPLTQELYPYEILPLNKYYKLLDSIDNIISNKGYECFDYKVTGVLMNSDLKNKLNMAKQINWFLKLRKIKVRQFIVYSILKVSKDLGVIRSQ